jgi:hypothetical protein
MATTSWGVLGPDEYELGDIEALAAEYKPYDDWLRAFV